MTKDRIRINKLTKRYGKTTALDNVTTDFEFGKIYGLLGRNGAGKSTMIKVITNRAFAGEGEVTVNGEKTEENPRLKDLIFFMSEEDFYTTYKLKELLKITSMLYPGFDSERALKYAKLFELDLRKKFSALSTGYKNIFKLIITLCQDLPYLIFDEPVVGLDAYHRELFYKLLLECYAEGERTIIIATHLIEEISGIIEDVVIIDNGKILLKDSVEDLLSKGHSIAGRPDLVNAYIKDRNVIDTEDISGLKIAYLMESPNENIPDELSVSQLNLQKLFVRLTGGNEDE